MAETGNHVRKVRQDDPLMAVIEPALKVGAGFGTAGFLVGGTSGILKGTTPGLFATATAIQSFCLGTLFWSARGGIIQAWGSESLRSNDLTKANAVAGGVSGGLIGFLFRGKRNIIPGALGMAFFGAAGQAVINWRTAAAARPKAPKVVVSEPEKKRSWSPLQRMTNEEYADMLREKLLKVDVEISILDDKIAALRQQDKETTVEPSPTTTK